MPKRLQIRRTDNGGKIRLPSLLSSRFSVLDRADRRTRPRTPVYTCWKMLKYCHFVPPLCRASNTFQAAQLDPHIVWAQ